MSFPEALAALHSVTITHRDLKCENILVLIRQMVRLSQSDLGVSYDDSRVGAPEIILIAEIIPTKCFQNVTRSGTGELL
jgi:hypothetical protein